MQTHKIDGATSSPVYIGSYEIVGVLGHGGMGVVYDAVHRVSGHRVALKTVTAAHRKHLTAIRTEILALRSIRHPNIVAIIDEGLSESTPWFTMERIDGRTLRDSNGDLWGLDPGGPSQATIVRGATHDASGFTAPGHPTDRAPEISASPNVRSLVAAGRLAEMLDLYRLLCESLAYVHRAGIVHRDIKPSNVLLRSDGTPVLTDFGLASRAFDATGRDALDLVGRFVGSAPYVAPEQIRGEFVDARADLYALGCMLHETLTGRPPFLGATARSLLDQHLEQSPLPPSHWVSGVPHWIDALVLRLLAKRPQDRIGHADDILATLRNSELLKIQPTAISYNSASNYLYRPALSGRAELIAQIESVLGRAERESGQLALIEGESGIGKTFFASEMARRAALRGFQVIAGECTMIAGADIPVSSHLTHFDPLHRLLQTIVDRCREGGVDVTSRLLAGRAEILAPFEPALLSLKSSGFTGDVTALPPEAARRRAMNALTATLQELANEAPLLLILDDLQWADELTLGFLQSLTSDLFKRSRLVVACLYRTEEISDPVRQFLRRRDALHFKLTRLSPAALEAMISDMIAMQPAPDALVRFIVQHSEGNPFFAAEILRLLTADGLIERRLGEWRITQQIPSNTSSQGHLSLPGSIQEVIRRRLTGLSKPERELISAAAVLGRTFEDDTLAGILDITPSDFAAILRQLTAKQVLEEIAPTSHRFTHDKVRSVLYEDIPESLRRELHSNCALAIERIMSPNSADQYSGLAHHFSQAGNEAKALLYTEKAADQALSQFANGEAVQYYRQLLDNSPPDTRPQAVEMRARWERRLGDALHGLGRLDALPGQPADGASRHHLETALKLLDHPLPNSKARLVGGIARELGRQVVHRAFGDSLPKSWRKDRVRSREASQAYDRLLQIFYYRGLQLEMLYSTLKTLNLAEIGGAYPEMATAYSIAHAVAGVIPVRSLADSYVERARRALAITPDSAVESYLDLLVGVYRTGTMEWTLAHQALEHGFQVASNLGFERRCDELILALANWSYLRGDYVASRRHADALATSVARGDLQAQVWQALLHSQLDLIDDLPQQALARARFAHRLAFGCDLESVLASTDRLSSTAGQHATGHKDNPASPNTLPRSELIWTLGVLSCALFRSGALTDADRCAALALEQILAGPPGTFYCIEAYAYVAEVLLRRCAQSSHDRRQHFARARTACSALTAFARVFPAAKPRALIAAGTLTQLRAKTARARTILTGSVNLASAGQMPHEEASGRWLLARALPPEDRARGPMLARVVQAATERGATHLAHLAQCDLDDRLQ
jgi:serine/threonine protein kinase